MLLQSRVELYHLLEENGFTLQTAMSWRNLPGRAVPGVRGADVISDMCAVLELLGTLSDFPGEPITGFVRCFVDLRTPAAGGHRHDTSDGAIRFVTDNIRTLLGNPDSKLKANNRAEGLPDDDVLPRRVVQWLLAVGEWELLDHLLTMPCYEDTQLTMEDVVGMVHSIVRAATNGDDGDEWNQVEFAMHFRTQFERTLRIGCLLVERVERHCEHTTTEIETILLPAMRVATATQTAVPLGLALGMQVLLLSYPQYTSLVDMQLVVPPSSLQLQRSLLVLPAKYSVPMLCLAEPTVRRQLLVGHAELFARVYKQYPVAKQLNDEYEAQHTSFVEETLAGTKRRAADDNNEDNNNNGAPALKRRVTTAGM